MKFDESILQIVKKKDIDTLSDFRKDLIRKFEEKCKEITNNPKESVRTKEHWKKVLESEDAEYILLNGNSEWAEDFAIINRNQKFICIFDRVIDSLVYPDKSAATDVQIYVKFSLILALLKEPAYCYDARLLAYQMHDTGEDFYIAGYTNPCKLDKFFQSACLDVDCKDLNKNDYKVFDRLVFRISERILKVLYGNYLENSQFYCPHY